MERVSSDEPSGGDRVGPPPPVTIVGICGGSGSGKTTLATRLVDGIGPDAAVELSFDSYYRELAHLTVEQRSEVNFDHPDSLDAGLLLEHLQNLRAGREVAVPVYDFTTSTRSGDLEIVHPHRFVVVEGILLFAFPAIRAELDVAVFRDCDEVTRAERRFRRDVTERGRSPESVDRQWRTTVQPMYRIHVEPHMAGADLVVTPDQDLDRVVAELVASLTSSTASGRPAARP